jgi:hypothetical protein
MTAPKIMGARLLLRTLAEEGAIPNMSATAKSAMRNPLSLFDLNQEEYCLLNHVSDRPRRWNGFSPDAADYLRRRHLVNICSHGLLLLITVAGKATLEAIAILCT